MKLEELTPKHIKKFRFDSFDDCISRLMEEGNVDNIESARAICATLYYEDTGHFPHEHADKSYECPLCGIEGGGNVTTKQGKDIKIKESKSSSSEIRGTILKQYEEQMIVEGAVLIPNEPDYDDDRVSKAKIERVAHEWMLKYRNIDLKHSLNNIAYPVESWILREDRTVKSLKGKEMLLPAGTWMMSVKVQDKATWEAIKRGELNGFSITGVPKEEINTVIKSQSEEPVALKRVTLADIEDAGKDWVVPAVGIVDEPAVPKALFVSLKNKKDEEESKGFMNRVKEIFSSKEKTSKDLKLDINGHEFAIKEGREFNRENRQKLEAMLVVLSDMLGDYNVELVDTEDGQERRIKPTDIVEYIDEREGTQGIALFGKDTEEFKKNLAKKASELNEFLTEEEVLLMLDKDYKGGINMEKEELLEILQKFKDDVLGEVEETLTSVKEKEENLENPEEVEETEEKEEEVEEEEEEETSEKEKEETEETEEEVEEEEEEEDSELEELKETVKNLEEENQELKDALLTIKNKFTKTTKTHQPAGNDSDDGEKVEKANSRYDGRDKFGLRKR